MKRAWIAALAAVAAMAGAAVAHHHTDLQAELDQVQAQLQAVQGRLAEMSRAETGVAGLSAAMREDLEALAGKVGIFDVGIGATLVVQHGMDVQQNTRRRGYQTNQAILEAMIGVAESSRQGGGVPTQPGVFDRSRLDASVSVDFDLAARLMPGAVAYMRVEADQGDAIHRQTGTVSGVNRAAQNKDALLTLSELWYQQSFEADMLVLTVGKIDFTRMFDANAVAGDENTQFLSNALVDNMTLDYPSGRTGESYGVSPGFVARLNSAGVAPVNNWYVMAGAADSSQDFSRAFKDAFAIIEAGAVLELVHGLPGNYRGYAWINKGGQIRIRRPAQRWFDEGFPPGRKTGQDDEDGMGWGVSFDQKIHDAVTLFFRWGMRQERRYMVNRAYSFGVLYDGNLWGRDRDAVGVGFNKAKLGNPAKRAIKNLRGRRTQEGYSSGQGTGDEVLGEIFYRFQVNDYLAASPVVQWVKNPGTLSRRKDLWVFGLRARAEF